MTAHRFRFVVVENASDTLSDFYSWLSQTNVNLNAWEQDTTNSTAPSMEVTDYANDDPISTPDFDGSYYYDELAWTATETQSELDSRTFSTPIENFRQNAIGTGVWAFPDDDPRSVAPEDGNGYLADNASDCIYEHSLTYGLDWGVVGAEHAELVDRFYIGNPPEVL
jgi:hypothetical protein